MAQCDYCGKEAAPLSTFTCSYCGKMFCPEHRLPFNHNCVHIEAWKQASPPGQRSVTQQKIRAPISTKSSFDAFALRDQGRNLFPWFIGVSAFVLIVIGIGVYVL
ncbi:MAG: hypothetical protein LBV40_05750 [Methanomicrobiales archaeon]|jgi:hypothetical protein|nr:hypothetical protein [Methanomicrobiales archaeon]